ncbi:MAG: NAD(P)-binding domain-containing protein [Burkholderiales bacterium]|nr:NAD(P)-binding domain-containing protein [Burkholderiales bacterium]
MKTNKASRQDRRSFFRIAGLVAASAALASMPLAARAAGAAAQKLKIGVIGSGRVGGTIGELWVNAGYEVMFSSLDLEHDKALAARLGAGARAGTSRQAGAFGDVLFIAVPYAALPQVGRDLGNALKDKIVLDACNPFPGRDGEMAIEARAKGTGIASPQFLPGARLVRAFNCVGYASMRSEAHRAGERLGIPLAGDDPAAIQVAVRLVQDAGFEPVVVGGLARAKDFDAGTPIFGIPMTAAEVRRTLGIGS